MLLAQHTVESYAQKHQLSRQSALNKLSKLRKQGFVTTSGGGPHKRIYKIYNTPQTKSNGFYDLVNKYSPEKLQPQFKHRIIGPYSVERAIIDGIRIGDARTLEATTHLFRHVKDWKSLFSLAKKYQCTEQVHKLYEKARKSFKSKAMPKRYRR